MTAMIVDAEDDIPGCDADTVQEYHDGATRAPAVSPPVHVTVLVPAWADGSVATHLAVPYMSKIVTTTGAGRESENAIVIVPVVGLKGCGVQTGDETVRGGIVAVTVNDTAEALDTVVATSSNVARTS